MTFYLKYRPQKIEELDLEDVRELLKKIIKSGKIPHAFLFSGPKGSGKTSAARILAKVVNCEKRRKNSIEPCNKCEQCALVTKGTNLDVVELDAASHRGIDDVRALRDAVKLASAKAEKKVYIIDEAHMLTTEAANALLKTLEEPPEHVMFVLATTNPEKLTETIRSRTTNILFKKATLAEIERQLGRIIAGEKIKADNETINLIAESSNGDFREAAKTLEQLVTQGSSFKKDDVEEFLFSRKTLKPENLISLLSKRETKTALAEVERVVAQGVPMENYIESILRILRVALLAKSGVEGEDLEDFSKTELVFLLKRFSQAASELRETIIEQLPVELVIVEWCDNSKKEEKDNSEKKTPLPEIKKITPPPARKNLKEVTDEVWKEILSRVRPINTSIEALLRAARPVNFDGGTLTLDVFYRFHKERLEDSRHRKILEEVIGAVLGAPIRVVCTLAEPPARKIEKKKEASVVLTEGEDEDIIKVAKEIFEN
jgi:DNA polymerase-3 subunit gamma/tau